MQSRRVVGIGSQGPGREDRRVGVADYWHPIWCVGFQVISACMENNIIRLLSG